MAALVDHSEATSKRGEALNNRTVLVCGGGIAGTALAFWLHRRGFTVTVVEHATGVRTGGYKVDIRGAAIEVVDRMGLLTQVRQQSTDMRFAVQYDNRGRRLATLDAELFGGRSDGDAEIMRGDLQHVLYEQTRGEAEYVFGDRAVSVREMGAGVEVTFAHGQRRSFDLVIGADGVNSATRGLVFGPPSRFLHDLGHAICVYSVPNYLGLDREEAVHLAPGRTVNVYSTAQTDFAKALFLFRSEPSELDSKTFVAKAMSEVGWEAPRLLSFLPEAADFYFDRLTQVQMDRWSAGRVALVGDAAYGASPASGQGTSLALVGAYALAGELSAAGGDHKIGFAAYEARMREFVARNQALAETNLRGMVVGSRTAVWLQTRMMRLLPHLPGRDAIIGRIAKTIHEAATAIALPDYGHVAV
ncbi:MAG TPA: FAD-dependent oxidoreductase [Micromonosporaceae bacterium]|nr:FAD-dependent oxidoreductase [Micromonosporaceae bacterium]HCU52658.1 FAD-dependent oxidoreductase [Micromonosporaceae bacterium]